MPVLLPGNRDGIHTLDLDVCMESEEELDTVPDRIGQEITERRKNCR